METQSPTVFSEKFEKIKAHFRLRNTDLARMAGVSDNAITKIIKGQTESPDVKTLIAIGKKLNLSADWVLYDEGPMIREEMVIDNSLKKGLQLRDELIAQLQKELWGKSKGATSKPLSTEAFDELMMTYRKSCFNQVSIPLTQKKKPVAKLVAPR